MNLYNVFRNRKWGKKSPVSVCITLFENDICDCLSVSYVSEFTPLQLIDL